ncbi:MAG: hypothetical protein LH481_17940, partial [Burkholderiales bacterium]|nr:hypothetical protein [Burkholderiales bacterium]
SIGGFVVKTTVPIRMITATITGGDITESMVPLGAIGCESSFSLTLFTIAFPKKYPRIDGREK